MRKFSPLALITIILLSFLLSVALAACDTTRRVEGGASDNGGGGRVRIGVPF